MTANGQSAHRLNARARGWLRFLWRKATTADDWSEDGEPHPWWDRYSTEPMLSFPRFDLSESSYALGIMADMTPAWREVYARILGVLVERHLTYWAAVDWLTQFGEDPRRKDYPEAWKGFLIPKHLFGSYDTPGWVANGISPWGLQPDPIGAEGNLFFKGWLNLVMALHVYVSGERLWDQPFKVAGVDRTRFEWTQSRLVERLVELWSRHPAGLHCENTKIWPFCLSAAGPGLQLFDALSGKLSHQVFETWLDYAKQNYFGIDESGKLRWTTFYYDPILDEHMRHGPAGGLPASLYILPQDPAYAEFLYQAAISQMGWNDPSKPIRATEDPRFLALGMVLAKELGDDRTGARLKAYAEEKFEPKYFGDIGDEFGWWFHFGEDWPRGQISALLMMSELGSRGAWSGLFRNPNIWKFDEPTVEGVDYPKCGIAQAWNDADKGELHIETYAADSSRRGTPTCFRITNLPDAKSVEVSCDGHPYSGWRLTSANVIEIDSQVDDRLFRIATGYRRTTSVPKKRDEQSFTKTRSINLIVRSSVTNTVGNTVFAPLPAGPCCISG